MDERSKMMKKQAKTRKKGRNEKRVNKQSEERRRKGKNRKHKENRRKLKERVEAETGKMYDQVNQRRERNVRKVKYYRQGKNV